MNTSCQNCGTQLKLSEKILGNLRKQGPGKSIRIKCPKCAAPIILDSSQLFASKADAGVKKQQDETTDRVEKPKSSAPLVHQGPVKPPGPPDISWLEGGIIDEEQVLEDVPLSLLLMHEHKNRDTIIEGVEGIGYKTEFVKTAEEAIEKMQFVDYSSVILHSQFEGNDLQSSLFHQYMCQMSMSKRRFIYYIIVGNEFKTLYNLQALAYSANLVVNESEIAYFNIIIRKAIPEYEELFGPIMEELRLHGK